MPETACAKPTKSGSPNNKLSSLEVTGYALTPTFDRDTENYDIIVNPSVDKIEVKAGAIDSAASVSGTGTVTLASGNNTIKVTVTAENGDVRTYQLNVVRQSDAPAVQVPDSGTSGSSSGSSSGIVINPDGSSGPGGSSSGQLSGPGAISQTSTSETTAAAAGGSQNVQVGIAPDGSTAGTTASLPETAAEETAAVQETTTAQASVQKGDVNGDGTLSVLDVMLIKKHILGETTLSGDAAAAADMNGDGNVNAADMAALQKQILEQG